MMIGILVGSTIGSASVVYADEYENTRVSGSNRYSTSQKVFEMVLTIINKVRVDIVVASGDNYPDALSGAYFAFKKNAPLILVNNEDTQSTLKSLMSKVSANKAKTVYILGGDSVVSSAFEEAAKANGYTTKRLGGNNRFETNMKVLEEIKAGTSDIIICSGENYPDALSASAIKLPIMLVGDKLTGEQIKFLSKNDDRNIFIMGGKSVVSSAIENKAKKYGDVTRLSGSNRYETSYEIAKYFYGAGYNKAKNVVLAYGQNFPDGLVIGPVAMKKSAPILLVDEANFDSARKFVQDNSIKKSITVGGTSIISDDTVKNVMSKEKPVVKAVIPTTGAAISSQLNSLIDSIYIPDYDWYGRKIDDVWIRNFLKTTTPTRRNVVIGALKQLGVSQHCVALVSNSLQYAGLTFKSPYTANGNYTDNPLPGDICNYNGHVAIYLGNDMAVHGGFDNYQTVIAKVRPSWPTFIGFIHLDI